MPSASGERIGCKVFSSNQSEDAVLHCMLLQSCPLTPACCAKWIGFCAWASDHGACEVTIMAPLPHLTKYLFTNSQNTAV